MAESLHSTCLIVSCRTVSLSALRDRFQARGDSLMLAHWKLQSKCPVLGCSQWASQADKLPQTWLHS